MNERDDVLRVRVLAAQGVGLASDEANLTRCLQGDSLDRFANALGLWRHGPLEPLARLAYALVMPAAVEELRTRWQSLNAAATSDWWYDGSEPRLVFRLGDHESDQRLSDFALRYDPEEVVEEVYEAAMSVVGFSLIEAFEPEATVRSLRTDLAKARADLADARVIAAEHKARGAVWCQERDDARRALEEQR
jgi:hypothetical protein